MEFQIDKFDTYTLVKVLEDSLETKVAPILKNELVFINGCSQKNIILDLSNCSYCDAAGLSAILTGNRLCKNSVGTFVLTGIYGQVERLLIQSGLDKILKITRGVRDAEALIKNTSQII
jgi:anti-anti-sigma factor